MAIWGDFQGITGVTRGGRGVEKMKNWGDVIDGWSLRGIEKLITFQICILWLLGNFERFLEFTRSEL